MNALTAHITQQRACEAIENAAFDFTAKFYAAYDLSYIARSHRQAIGPRSIQALQGLLLSTAFDGQRQRRFLFREAANVLATIVQIGRSKPIARNAYDAMMAVLQHGRGHAHQATAEALGSLPLALRGPKFPKAADERVASIDWQALPGVHHLPRSEAFSMEGRSLTALLEGGNRRVVVKLAGPSHEDDGLRREAEWITRLGDLAFPAECRFDVPRLLRVDGARCFRLRGLPPELTPAAVCGAVPLAIAFIASRDYYDYPNDGRGGSPPDARAFVEMMAANASLLGWLAGQGIIHEAPIPLFHNRVQQERRRDGGVYEWFRAGRLDRWLASCAYPNFGRSGLRDFEHFNSFQGRNLDLFRHMGNHLLSLLLVAGSYFRVRDPLRVGWQADGQPVDARDLFDRDLLGKVVHGIFRQYHLGFVGNPPTVPPPLNVDRLTDRMIDEMGVDRHMEEFLRVADQLQMTRPEFEDFLKERGYDSGSVAALEKGVRDLAVLSGPHLGAFNRGISLPEIVEAAAAMAAVCVAERFVLASG